MKNYEYVSVDNGITEDVTILVGTAAEVKSVYKALLRSNFFEPEFSNFPAFNPVNKYGIKIDGNKMQILSANTVLEYFLDSEGLMMLLSDCGDCTPRRGRVTIDE